MFSSPSKLFKYLFILSVLGSIFAYGVAVGTYKIYPYSHISSLKQMIKVNTHEIRRNKEHRVQLFEEFPAYADIVFIGDSITEGGEWNDFFPNLNISNRGVGGDMTSDVIVRMDSVIAVNPKVAIIMLGINDIYNKVSNDEIVANYSSIVGMLVKNKVEVIIQSTIQCELKECGQDKVSQVNALNDKLLMLSHELNVSYVFLEDLSSQKGLSSDFTYDGVHLTADGYRNWVEEISEVLLSY